MARVGIFFVAAALLLSGRAAAASPDTRVVDAVKAHDAAALRMLVRQRADVNAPDQDGATPLLWAAHLGDLDAATILIKAGARVTAANLYGATALYEASTRGDVALVEALLKAGADSNAALQAGETPLMAAARTNSLAAVRLLVAHGADLNAKETWQGQTALMRALAQGQTAVVKLLVELGADPNTPATPSTLPQYRDQFRLGTRFFVNHSTGGLSPLMFAARQGDIAAVRILLEGGATKSLNYTNPDGVSALMIAILNGNFDIAGLLLGAGADPNDGSLYQAVEMHNSGLLETVGDASRPRVVSLDNKLDALELMKQLLARGANPNAVFTKLLHVDGERPPPLPNITPLIRALRAADLPTIELLLANGADPNLVMAPVTGPTGQAAANPGASAVSTPPIVVAMQGADTVQFAGGTGTTGTKVYRFPARRDPIEAVRLCVLAGADVNAVSPQGVAAVHLAAQRGADDLVRFLWERGAKLDVPDKQGLTPLDYALGKVPTLAPTPQGGPAPVAPPIVRESTVALLRSLMEQRPSGRN